MTRQTSHRSHVVSWRNAHWAFLAGTLVSACNSHPLQAPVAPYARTAVSPGTAANPALLA